MKIVDLPEVIHILFKSFLSNCDFIQFLSSSQGDFQEIRRSHIYFCLNDLNSERFCIDKSYRDYILSRVTRPDRQISMILSIDMVQNYKHLLFVHKLQIKEQSYHIDHYIPFLPVMGIVMFWSSLIQDISSLSQVESIELFGCKGITDIYPLKNVKEVKISICDDIRDFSCLGNQETLELCRSDLINVTNFSGIQRLSIHLCANLCDVSPLYGIPFLSISVCAKVNDISCLGNHIRLRISRCSYTLRGYQILETVKDISLDSCDIADVSMMKKARSVELSNLSQLQDVSSLANVKELTLVNCREIKDISMLEKVKAIHLSSLPAIKSYESIEHHPNLTISCDQSKDNMDTLKKFCSAVKNLSLKQIDFSAFVPLLPSFSRLMDLFISDNDEEFELQGCEDIHTVQLDFCSKIRSTKGLGRNRNVIIIGCDQMSDVSHLANVPIVTIRRCSKLIDVSCLVNVPKLKISSCGVDYVAHL